MMKGRVFALMLVGALAACGSDKPAPPKPSLIYDSRVVFVEADGKTARTPPREAMRVWVPHLVGDIFGSPNEGEVARVTLRSDLTFQLDLNGAGKTLEKALVPTKFTQKWMLVEPADARVARLIPFVMEADNIAPMGTAEWLDRDSGRKLMLIYVDRPARIRGDIVYDERSLQFDIVATEAGYLWVEQPQGNGLFHAVPTPKALVLAVLPD